MLFLCLCVFLFAALLSFSDVLTFTVFSPVFVSFVVFLPFSYFLYCFVSFFLSLSFFPFLSTRNGLIIHLNHKISQTFPAKIYLFKVSSRSTRKRCEICSKLAIKTLERHHWRCTCVFIVNFEHISPPFLVCCCWFWTSKCLLVSEIIHYL